MTHPSTTEIEDFVSGAVAPNTALTNHLSTCDACAALVRDAARVEMAMHEVGEGTRFCVACACVATQSRCSSCGAALFVRDYRIEKVLATGPLGRVYAAVDAAGVRVAVKELAFVGMASGDALAAFEREAKVLERLTHPGIPRFVDSFSEGRGVDARAYLVQELIDGESLATHLSRQSLTEVEVVEIARQVIDILVYLQSLSPMVFHRDIKPANLIRRPDGSIALVDFGAARDLGSTAGATVVGTFGYMPVEQLAGIVDATTDLHALGATLWHLLTRIEPWRLWADSLLQRRANVSASLRRFLDRLVARDSRRRFSGAVAARDALTGLTGKRSFMRPILAMRPTRWAAAAAALLVVGAGGFVATKRASDFFARYRQGQALMRAAGEMPSQEMAIGWTYPSVLVNDVRARLGPIRGCYEQALKRKPSLRGKVQVRVHVAESGKVNKATIENDTVYDADMAVCITDVIATWTVEPPKDGPASFSYPFIFDSPNTREPGEQVAPAPASTEMEGEDKRLQRKRMAAAMAAQSFGLDEQLLRGLNNEDRGDVVAALGKLAKLQGVEGLVAVDRKGHLVGSAGTLDPAALAAARDTNTSGRAQASVRVIGTQSYVVGTANLYYLRGAIGQLVVALSMHAFTIGPGLPKSRRVVPGEPQVRGLLDKNTITPVIRRHLDEVKACYEKELAVRPNLAGRVMIQFAIGGDGKVVQSVVQETTMNNPNVELCIAEAVHSWQFPKPPGEGLVIVSYPFTLESPKTPKGWPDPERALGGTEVVTLRTTTSASAPKKNAAPRA